MEITFGLTITNISIYFLIHHTVSTEDISQFLDSIPEGNTPSGIRSVLSISHNLQRNRMTHHLLSRYQTLLLDVDGFVSNIAIKYGDIRLQI